ncbi:MAG: helix-turn-helix transcriptional regulator [Pseudomonadota bacterium]
MRHDDIWRGIDALAAAHGMSASALARKAGLDATAFNPSKRFSSGGRPRWPSTESVGRALEAVDASLGDLANLIANKPDGSRIPIIGFAEAGRDGFFDAKGLPTGRAWSQVTLPAGTDDALYALEVSGTSMLPTFRPGDRLIVAPKADVSPGDRIVLRTSDGEVMAKELVERRKGLVSVRSLNPDFSPRSVPESEITWLARIQWVSQ